MNHDTLFRYRLSRSVAPADAETTLLRAIMSVESLHGESQARLDIRHSWDESGRICVLDASTQVGRDLNRLFTGFLKREYGDDAFVVERVNLVSEASQEGSSP